MTIAPASPPTDHETTPHITPARRSPTAPGRPRSTVRVQRHVVRASWVAGLAALLGSLFAAAPAQAAPRTAVMVTVTVQDTSAGLLPVSDAASAWSKNTNVSLTLGSCTGPTCVIVQHASPPITSGVSLDQVGGMAMTNPDGSCTAMVAPWLDAYPDARRAALEHEIGHCLGLPHITTDARSIMQPVLSLSNPPRSPDAKDRAALRALRS